MSKFNRGDRVRFCGMDRIYRVVGDLHNDPTRVAVEEGSPGAHSFDARESELTLVPQIPDVNRPYLVYGPDGCLYTWCELMETAIAAGKKKGRVIYHITSGRWFDNQGMEISK